jgi:1,4-alpha-glucan branching enzyme
MQSLYITIFRIIGLLTIICAAKAQVIITDPSPIDPTKPVTITFYADRGSAGLRGFNGDIYAHTGVITNKSTGPADWKYVKTNWGQNTEATKLTRIATDRYTLTIDNIRTYYGVPQSETILRLAFVFRSADATREGKNTGGTDIYADVLRIGISASFINPQRDQVLAETGEAITIKAIAQANQTALSNFSLFQNGNLFVNGNKDTIIETSFTPSATGTYIFTAIAADTSGNKDSSKFTAIVVPATKESAIPQGIVEGVNIINDSSAIFCLFAPYHKIVYLLGDFNDYKIDSAYQMNKHTINQDSVYFWIKINGLQQGTEYGYQYLVDATIRVADPYGNKMLTEFNDDEIINQNRYPGLKPYPKGKTNEFVSVFRMRPKDQTEIFPYTWKNPYKRLPAKDLTIYELLVRDFTDRRTFQAVIDSLDYLQKLGINAVQLMPVQEFEGNLSWGYDPAFHFAVDKFYGTEINLKTLIDEAHKRGMAVILDVVLNHLTGSSPLIRMWASGKYGPPAANNPYANVTARHPFNVFNDLNHESIALQRYIDRFNKYWLQEFKVDGFRYDLSKGFTQVNSGDNVSRWSSYDSTRIRLLKRMYGKIREYDSNAYLILEHFADSREEKELTDNGFMVWHNMNSTYIDASMGWINGLSDNGTNQVYFKNRNLNVPNNVAYMESHDEERLMKKHYCYGNTTQPGYSTKDTTIALQKAAAAAALFFPVPGPKMIWQFGELGYDIGLQLNNQCTDDASQRLSIKPQRWIYREDARRQTLYQIYSALISLRSLPVFNSLETQLTFKASRGDSVRWIQYKHPSMNALIVANMGVKPRRIDLPYPGEGDYYDFFTGSRLSVSSAGNPLNLQPGAFHVFTSAPLPRPEIQNAWQVLNIQEQSMNNTVICAPNPAPAFQPITVQPPSYSGTYQLFSVNGKLIEKGIYQQNSAFVIENIPPGVYSLQFLSADAQNTLISRIIFQ